MAIEIYDAILAFTVYSLMQIFDYLRSSGFCFREMRIHVVEEDRQGLCSITELCRTLVSASALDHDAGFPCVHLCAADGLSVAVVLDEAKNSGEPVDRFGEVLIHNVRQHGVGWHGTVGCHAGDFTIASRMNISNCD